MSDPRYTGSGYRDPRHTDPIEPRQMRTSSGWDPMWGWVAAIIALAVAIMLVAGYYRHEPSTASREPSAPTTTGAASSANNPKVPPPQPITPAAPTAPANPAPALAAPAEPAPGPAPHP